MRSIGRRSLRRGRGRIAAASIDAFGGYANALGSGLPDAILVMDHFHNIALANRSVDQTSRRVQTGTFKHLVWAWVAQADIDGGNRAGATSEDGRRIKELERENRKLKRTNEILRKASAFPGGARPPLSLTVELIDANRPEYWVEARAHLCSSADIRLFALEHGG